MSAPPQPALLDALVPLHLTFDRAGRVRSTGPTLERIAPGAVGRALEDVLDIRHPAPQGGGTGLLALAGRRLEMRLRCERGVPPEAQPTRMRGVVYPLPPDQGLLVVFFGADLPGAVARHGLTSGDLAQFDLTVEVLFLLEARNAVLAEQARTAARLRDAGREAARQAVTDKLTGLHNRRAMDRRLSELGAQRGARPFGLMQLDLDHFKAVNDRFGHSAGDRVLERVGEVLRAVVREGDMVARMGGDEFMILLDGCDDLDRMECVAARIIEGLEAPVGFEGEACRISGSLGITLSVFYDAVEPRRMIADLDAATYASKHAGRARFSVARPEGALRAG